MMQFGNKHCSVDYRIIPELQLWVEYYSGVVTVETIISQRRKVILDTLYHGDYNAVADFRDADLQINLKGLLEFIALLKSNARMQGNRFVGILTHTPQQVAITSLYRMHLDTLPMKIEIFSTVEAIARYVGLGDRVKELEQILLSLREPVS